MNDLNFEPKSTDEFSSLIKQGGFDYVDFGCSKGGSLLFGKQAFKGKKGLGIDCDQSKVELTRNAGYDAVKFNIHDIPDEKLVRFTILSHFLEHVPDLADVTEFVKKACSISTEFVYIQQPFFDADGYLARNGLKLFWSDWRGHPNRMTSLEMWVMLRNLHKMGMDIKYSIHFRYRIMDSSDSRIHSIFSPIDQLEYSETEHPDKGDVVEFREPVYAEIRAVITMPGVDHSNLVKKVKSDYVFIDEDANKPVDKFRKKVPQQTETQETSILGKLGKLFG